MSAACTESWHGVASGASLGDRQPLPLLFEATRIRTLCGSVRGGTCASPLASERTSASSSRAPRSGERKSTATPASEMGSTLRQAGQPEARFLREAQTRASHEARRHVRAKTQPIRWSRLGTQLSTLPMSTLPIARAPRLDLLSTIVWSFSLRRSGSPVGLLQPAP